jgi:hypothetical protein
MSFFLYLVQHNFKDKHEASKPEHPMESILTSFDSPENSLPKFRISRGNSWDKVTLPRKMNPLVLARYGGTGEGTATSSGFVTT